MDLIGCIDNINIAVTRIDSGRKGFAIEGKEREGRLSYEKGIAQAISSFKEVQVSADSQALILAEYTFLVQELSLCDKTDKDSLSSLANAIADFDDAFLVLPIVEDKTLYMGVEKSYPHKGKFRVSGFPKDAFHLACISHRTRLQNILRSPGIDPIEKTLLKQRLANLAAAQSSYVEKQKKALQRELYESP